MTESYELMLVEDEAVASVQAMALRLLREQKLTKTQLAERMGVTAPRISQLFADEPENLSIKAAARLFYHLGEELVFSCAGIDKLNARAEEEDERRAEALRRKWPGVVEWKSFGTANDFPCNSSVTSMEAA